ncbi:MAG TPA: hypothetical protein VF649_00625 [Sphingomonas sp.]|jgi:hypothetical protein|uniref:hypothetical protein n=1 Tax=Sphingomonas sp. TaxID=28214 RepID=UPI002EDABBFC
MTTVETMVRGASVPALMLFAATVVHGQSVGIVWLCPVIRFAVAGWSADPGVGRDVRPPAWSDACHRRQVAVIAGIQMNVRSDHLSTNLSKMIDHPLVFQF